MSATDRTSRLGRLDRKGRFRCRPAAIQAIRECRGLPRSCRSQRRPRMAELGERLGRRSSATFATPPSRWLQCRGGCFADIPSLIARLRAPPSPAGAAWGQIRGDERRRVPRCSQNRAFSTSALSGWRFDRVPDTQSRISPCSVRLSERSWPHDCRNIRRDVG